MTAALYADLGKPALEAAAFELGAIVERSLLCAKQLETWSRPDEVYKEPGTLMPEWQKAWRPTVYKQPKGPVLVIAYV